MFSSSRSNASMAQANSHTLRALGALLAYPDAPLRGHLSELRELLRAQGTLSPSRMAEIEALIASIAHADPLDAEADYVELFDRGRRTSLHLFEHVYGDSRERGQAMVDLAQTYEKAGLFLAEGELPDYLPAVLEFASTQPLREARAFLGEFAHLLNAIFAALCERASPYASVVGALIELAGETARPVAPRAGPSQRAPSRSLAPSPATSPPEESLDDSWMEPQVFDGCSSRGQGMPGDVQPVRIVRRNQTERRMTP